MTVAGVPTTSSSLASVPADLAVEVVEIWALDANGGAEFAGPGKSAEKEGEPTRLTSLTRDCNHPWVLRASPYNLYRAAPVYMVPAHLTVKVAVQILLKREGDAGVSASFAGAPTSGLAELTIA